MFREPDHKTAMTRPTNEASSKSSGESLKKTSTRRRVHETASKSSKKSLKSSRRASKDSRKKKGSSKKAPHKVIIPFSVYVNAAHYTCRSLGSFDLRAPAYTGVEKFRAEQGRPLPVRVLRCPIVANARSARKCNEPNDQTRTQLAFPFLVSWLSYILQPTCKQ